MGGQHQHILLEPMLVKREIKRLLIILLQMEVLTGHVMEVMEEIM
ncbi:MAG TPA: hypothetical protein VIY47_09405 [Ignavibacteriaceae bacterium]